MNDIVFNLQRFADDGTLTDAEKKAARESSLPHLRMISSVAKNPIVSGLVTAMETAADFTDILSKNVAPIYSFVGAMYKLKHGKNATRDMQAEAKLFSAGIKFVNSALEIIETAADTEHTVVAFTEKVTATVNEAFKICDAIRRLEGDRGIMLSITTAAMAYGLSVLATLDDDKINSEDQTKINKAFTKLGFTAVTSILKTMDKSTVPFGAADLALSVLCGLFEGMSQMDIRKEYYSDDGLPEDLVRNEALTDALLSGLHETINTYNKGIDDAIFNISTAIGYGLAWLSEQTAHFLTDKNYTAFNYTINERNYMEWIAETIRKGEYNSSSYSDIITVASSGTSVYAQDGNDYIENVFPNVTIFAGHGNDMVSSYGGAKYNSIHGGNGNDNLYITNSYSTIDGGKDDDFIFVYQGKNSINGNDGSDIILVRGEANTVSGGAGDDFFDLTDSTKTIIDYTQGDGQDVIYGYNTSHVIKIKGAYSTLESGNDIIIKVGDGEIIVDEAKKLNLKVNINTIELEEGETLPDPEGTGITNPYDNAIILMPSFRGNSEALRGTNNGDYIENTLSNIMIYGFDGNDTIINYGANVTINAGAGNDHVKNYGANVKINGGDDNDYIYSEGSKATISGGDGKDTVENTGNNSYIDGGNDMDSIKNSGNNTDINSGTGKDRILNSASNVRATGYLDDNYISNTSSNVTLEGSEDNDYIYNSGNYVSIVAGEGNNSVSIDSFVNGYNTIEAGNGDDIVQVGERDETEEKRYHNEIYAGNGNNYINNSNVELSTVVAGSGRNLVSLSGGKYNTIVTGKGNDTIMLAEDASSNVIIFGGGNDLVLNYHSSDTVKAASTLSTRIVDNDVILTDGTSKMTLKGAADKTINTATLSSGDSIYKILVADKTAGDSLMPDGKAVTVPPDTTPASVITNTVKGALVTGTKFKDIIENKGSKATVQALGGNDSINNKSSSVSINASSGDDYISNTGAKVTILGGDGKDYVENYGKKASVSGGVDNDKLYNYGANATISGDTGNDIIRNWDGDEGYGSNVSISGGTGNDSIWNNDGVKVTINAGKGNDYINNTGNNVLFAYAKGDGNDKIVGFNTTSTLKIGDGSDTYSLTKKDKNYIVTVGEGKITLVGAASLSTIFIDGDNTLKVTDKTKSPVTAHPAIKVINASTRTKATKITGNAFANIISGGSKSDSIYGGAGNDSLVGNAGNDKLYGEAGNDKLHGGTGNDSLWGGDGKDVFFYADGDGKDVIVDFTAGQDKIKITKGSISKSSLSGSDVIFTIGSGSLKVKNAKGKSISLINSSGKTSSTIVGAQTLTNNSSANVSIASDMSVVNASTRTKAIKITGNALANTISGGSKNDSIYGGAGNDSLVGNAGNDKLYGETGNDKLRGGTGNDSLWGGKGNDSLWGDAGNDTFFYSNGDGKDIIYGFENDDLLKITDTFSASYNQSKKEVYFKVGNTSNAITLKEFSATTFHVNNDIYQVSGSKLVKK